LSSLGLSWGLRTKLINLFTTISKYSVYPIKKYYI
jgi:hypothetical protein